MKISDLPAEVLAPVHHLLGEIEGVDLPTPRGWHVLALQYVRGEASKGGILFSDQTKKEDVYQGRVGLVLALGEDAYKGDKFSSGPWCKPGDWIIWPPVEAAAARFAYGKDVTLVLLADDRVLATDIDPLRSVSKG